MRPAFRPRLINNPFFDPGLFVSFAFEKRALLFDLGDLHELSPRELLKVTHAFVTHTHMDHFIGFDTLLRLCLGRNKEIRLFGPPGFLGHVEGKLSGYTWNLVGNYENRFSIGATEVHGDHTLTKRYHCTEAFKNDAAPERSPFSGKLLEEPSFWVEAVHLDHKIPCLAFKLEERFHVNIIKQRLDEMGIPVGPWLKYFKDELYKPHGGEERFAVQWEESGKINRREFALEDLAAQITRISKGQRIVYVVDVAFTEDNVERIVHLAQSADILFIEAAFCEQEAPVAQRKFHLTAKQAGILARRAGVKQFVLLHFSPRYADKPDRLRQEADQAFANPWEATQSWG